MNGLSLTSKEVIYKIDSFPSISLSNLLPNLFDIQSLIIDDMFFGNTKCLMQIINRLLGTSGNEEFGHVRVPSISEESKIENQIIVDL